MTSFKKFNNNVLINTDEIVSIKKKSIKNHIFRSSEGYQGPYPPSYTPIIELNLKNGETMNIRYESREDRNKEFFTLNK